MSTPSTDPYDLLFPSPISLEELAVSSLSITLWRCEIGIHRANKSLGEFHRRIVSEKLPSVPVKSTIHAPSIIIAAVETCVKKIGNSIIDWLSYHYDYVFCYHRTKCYDIFEDFDDLVCDFDNTIHYDRTAKRMMSSEAITTLEQFRIACLYSFENDILQMWPSVSSVSNIKSDEFNLGQMDYWISHLRRASSKRGFLEYDLGSRVYGNWSTIKYFLKKFKDEVNINMESLSSNHPKIFFRYVLQKLDEYEFEEARSDLIYSLAVWVRTNVNQECVIAAWICLKEKLSVKDFFEFFNVVFEEGELSDSTEEFCAIVASVLCKLWKCSPDKLKRPMIRALLNNADKASGKYYEYVSNPDHDFNLSDIVRTAYQIMSFRDFTPLFLTILSDATKEEKIDYWNREWIVLFKRENDDTFHQFMNTCLGNESEVIEFKNRILSDYKNFDYYCIELISSARFEKLNKFLNFLCSDELLITDLKKRILSELANPAISCGLHVDFIHHYESFDAFINSAYANAELASDFKKEIVMSPSIIKLLSLYVLPGQFSLIKNFVKKFVSSEQDVAMFKDRFINLFPAHLVNHSDQIQLFKVTEFQNFLRWCLGNDEKVTNFKQSLPIDEIVRNWTRTIEMRRQRKKLSNTQDAFLEWYFITPSAVKGYKRRVIPKYV